MDKMSYCIDIELPVIIGNLEKRQWVHVGPEDNWNLYWTSNKTFQCLFKVDNNYRLNDNQMINHFPNHSELCRKDLLIR